MESIVERELSNIARVSCFSPFSEKTEFFPFIQCAVARLATAHMEAQAFALNRSISLAIIIIFIFVFSHVPYADAKTEERTTKTVRNLMWRISFKLDFSSIYGGSLSTTKKREEKKRKKSKSDIRFMMARCGWCEWRAMAGHGCVGNWNLKCCEHGFGSRYWKWEIIISERNWLKSFGYRQMLAHSRSPVDMGSYD